MKALRNKRFAVRFTQKEKRGLTRFAVEQDRTVASVLRQAVHMLLAGSKEDKR